LPSVNKLYTDLKPKGLELVMVDFREKAELVRKTARERGYAGHVLIDESGDTTGRVYGVFGTPTFYLIDRQGRLVGRAVGAREWEGDGARRLLQDLLGAPEGR
jgi:AhpC/TSA family